MISNTSANTQTADVNRNTVAAVIPSYLEEMHIGDVVSRARAELDHVLVVDDGSRDLTARRAADAGAEVIVHQHNCGKGEAIKSGLRHWMSREFQYVLILDGDGQHRPEEIPSFLAAASLHEAKFVIGTRMSNPKGMPLVRRLVNKYMSAKISRLCGQTIPDTQCGFRMVHQSLIPELLSGQRRFDYETEMLILVSRNHVRIVSVPVSTVYADEVSSINPIRDTIHFFKLMRRYRNMQS